MFNRRTQRYRARPSLARTRYQPGPLYMLVAGGERGPCPPSVCAPARSRPIRVLPYEGARNPLFPGGKLAALQVEQERRQRLRVLDAARRREPQRPVERDRLLVAFQ